MTDVAHDDTFEADWEDWPMPPDLIAECEFYLANPEPYPAPRVRIRAPGERCSSPAVIARFIEGRRRRASGSTVQPVRARPSHRARERRPSGRRVSHCGPLMQPAPSPPTAPASGSGEPQGTDSGEGGEPPARAFLADAPFPRELEPFLDAFVDMIVEDLLALTPEPD